MPRDTFISDNLINIRDHLRQNYEDMNHSAKTEESQSSDKEIHIDLKAPVAQAVNQLRSPDREYNEFAGKLQHDLAAIKAELESHQTRQEALTVFNEKLRELAEELQKLPVANSQVFFREFDHLKIIYYQETGRVAAFRNRPAGLIQPAQEKAPAKTKKDFLLPAAVIISALMICITLLVVFG